MGFEIIASNNSRITFKTGSSKLTFLRTNHQNCVYHFAFDIPHNKLSEAVQWLSIRTSLIKLHGENVIDFPNWNAKSVYFYDNNGNVLEFIARFENQNQSDDIFECSSIVSISEIAFVTDQVEMVADDFIKTYNLPYYERQLQRKDFSVVGDDNGLLIIVSSTRKWFPTDIRVAKFPTKVTIENADKSFEIIYE
jgi:hypothetical protein